MAANYVLLEKITVVAAGATSVTFSGIPQTGYTDLKLVFSGNGTVSNSGSQVQFNGSSTGYTGRYLRGTGAAADSYTQAAFGATAIWGTYFNSSTVTPTSQEFYIPNYTSANYKSVSVDAVEEGNAATYYAFISAHLWSNTAAITSISIFPDSGSFTQYSTFYLYGIAALGTTPAIVPYATGGDTIMTDGTYWYHAFKASGTFTPAKGLSCDVLVVAGGGGGGGAAQGTNGSGGGGAGGYLAYTSQSVSTAQTVTLGAGGAGGANTGANGAQGSNSQFGSLTASVGGGYGSLGASGQTGGTGGSGGGAYGTGGSATSGQGNAGAGAGSNYQGGGGGGAGSAGGNGGSGLALGAGGNGLNTLSTWFSATGTGVSGYIAGGGGGGQYFGADGTHTGGSGGGGTGGFSALPFVAPMTAATSGTANTGSGGGGGGNAEYTGAAGAGGSGGSGLVIVRYAV